MNLMTWKKMTKLLYLDGEAIAVLDYQDKYLEEVETYWFSDDLFHKFLNFIISIYAPPKFETKHLQLFTDEQAAGWYSGKLNDPIDFPVDISQ